MLFVKGAEVREAWSRNVEIRSDKVRYYCSMWANEDSDYLPRFRINRMKIHGLNLWIAGGPHSFATIHGYTKDQVLAWGEDDFMKIIELILSHCKETTLDIDMDQFLW